MDEEFDTSTDATANFNVADSFDVDSISELPVSEVADVPQKIGI